MNDVLIHQSAVTDVQALMKLKVMAQKHHPKAIDQVADQFEALFLQQILKSMRSANHFLSEDSPFKGKQAAMFEELLDKQRSMAMSNKNILGIANLIKQQLDPSHLNVKYHPRQVVGGLSNKQQAESKLAAGGRELFKCFVKKLFPIAKLIGDQWGIDPKLLIAQAAHETGWGQHINQNDDGTSSLNFFNIKASEGWSAETNVQSTYEFKQGQFEKVLERFKSYQSIGESFSDYISLITENPRYQSARENIQDPDDYMQSLQESGYATDPNYAKRVMTIYRGERLTSIVDELEEGK